MSRVLKGEPADPGIAAARPRRVLDGVVADARLEAARVVAEARARAADLVAGAAAAREEARLEGFRAGREEGLAAVSELVARARAAEDRRREELEPELRRLAVRIAEKILGRELALDPAAIESVVRTALAAARARREIVVRVHPDDVAAIVAARPRLAEALARPVDVAVRGDPEVGRGGCRIETEAGTIDGRLEVQLAAIERALCGEGGDAA